jgi:hypothetical protein
MYKQNYIFSKTFSYFVEQLLTVKYDFFILTVTDCILLCVCVCVEREFFFMDCAP